MNRFAFLIFLVTFSLIFNIDDSYAQWKSSCSAINTPVCDTTNSQQDNQIISDGQDGCIIAWRDGRDFSQNPIFRIFLQKLNNDGVSLWEKNGVGVSGTDILYTKFKIISDSHGGAIVIYVAQPFGFNIYAQRIDSLGNSIWNSTGVPIFNDYTPPDFDAVSDGKGGAIIVSPLGWDTITSQPKLVAQRIDPSGNLLWPQKNTIGGTLDRDHDNDLYKIISTEDGGSIITWQQNDIPGGQADFNLYAQKLDSNGISKWGIDGVVVCNSYSTQADAAMCTDLNNGCFITWLDYRSGANSYLQHLDKNGNPNLVANGIIIDTILDYPILISNIDSGAYLMHFGGINDVHNRSLTRIDKSGNILWYKLVPSIYGNNFYIENNQLLSDKQGGVFLTWDENNYGYDVVAQHIDKFGNFLWGPKGIPVSNPYVTSQINAHLVNDDLGGIIMCWDDSRGIFGSSSVDIYAQRIRSDGTLYGKSGLYKTIEADTNVLVSADKTYIRISECRSHVTWQSSFDTLNFISLNSQWLPSDTFLLIDNLTDTAYYRAIIDEPFACFDTTEIIKIIPYPKISSNFQLFPNPFVDHSYLFINLSIEINQAEVKIYDILGKEVRLNHGIENHEIRIEKENLTKGIYLIQLWNNSELIGSEKFIIK